MEEETGEHSAAAAFCERLHLVPTLVNMCKLTIHLLLCCLQSLSSLIQLRWYYSELSPHPAQHTACSMHRSECLGFYLSTCFKMQKLWPRLGFSAVFQFVERSSSSPAEFVFCSFRSTSDTIYDKYVSLTMMTLFSLDHHRLDRNLQASCRWGERK